MNNEKLNNLFQEIREEKVETSIQDVNKWIALSAASVGLFGLLSKFKLSFLLTKKLIIMSSITIAIGITCASVFLYSQGETKVKTTPLVSKAERSKTPINQLTNKSLIIENNKVNLQQPNVNKSNRATTETSIVPFLPLHQLNEIETTKTTTSPARIELKSNIISSKIESGIAIEERELKAFSKLDVSSAFDIFLSQGSTQSVRLEVDERFLDRVVTEVVGNKLNVKIRKGSSINNPKKWALYITVVQLTDIETSGAVDIVGETSIKLENLILKSSGACNYKMDISANLLEMDISGATDIELQGEVKSYKGDISGACKVQMSDCKIGNATMDISGASTAKMNISGILKADVSGASKLKNKDNAKQEDVRISGAAKYN